MLDESLAQAPILIVDDNEVNRSFLYSALASRGFARVTAVGSASEAIAAFTSARPELIVLDLLMPEMDGFECCRRIRDLPGGRDVPILIETKLTEQVHKRRAFEGGASDFISKPIYPDELFARVKVHLSNRLATHRLQSFKQRVDTELSSASQSQRSILPTEETIASIEDDYGLGIAGHFEPSSELGGDFWGIKRIDAAHVAVWIADFSGHGIAAALNVFRLHAFLMEHSAHASCPGQYLSHLNHKLWPLLMPGQFATMFYAVINRHSPRLSFASAGSSHPLLQHPGRQETSLIDASGRPLGIAAHRYPTQTIDFGIGDTLLLYSDAMTETVGMEGGVLGEIDIMRWMREAEGHPKPLIETMAQRFHRFIGSRWHDDLTLVAIRRQSLESR